MLIWGYTYLVSQSPLFMVQVLRAHYMAQGQHYFWGHKVQGPKAHCSREQCVLSPQGIRKMWH